MAFKDYASSIISGGASLAGNIIGAIQGNKNIDKQIAAQREENQKNRDWNKSMAELANRWSIEQWNRENEYNLPVNVMARLREGGVNPDLFYGNSGQNLAAASPNVTPTAASDPVDVSALGSKMTVGDITNNVVSQALASAQIEKLKADTVKTGQETESMISVAIPTPRSRFLKVLSESKLNAA
jgi:hypothetical protein